MCRKKLLLCITFCFGCFEDPFSSTDEQGAPESIIGYQVIGTVTENDGKPTTRGVGRSLIYQFVDRNTIRGEGRVTIETTSWSYFATGNIATIHLQYDVGEENYLLTFTSQTSGTFELSAEIYGRFTGWAKGTFTISPL